MKVYMPHTLLHCDVEMSVLANELRQRKMNLPGNEIRGVHNFDATLVGICVEKMTLSDSIIY